MKVQNSSLFSFSSLWYQSMGQHLGYLSEKSGSSSAFRKLRNSGFGHSFSMSFLMTAGKQKLPDVLGHSRLQGFLLQIIVWLLWKDMTAWQWPAVVLVNNL